MEQYIVSARKYRPSTFQSVVGQKALTATLKNAIDSDRLAQAYLFCGPRGVGKTSCARIFAKTINCLNPGPDGEACNECESCRSFIEGRSYNIVELDAASNNSVDDIRNISDQVRIPPQIGRYRVFIIDEVHMLSSQAFNAFLKTLEEPPHYVIFILATTEKHKVIPTILSRCQIYDFSRITVADIAEHLQYVASQEGITAESEALNVIARKADGAMRDALSIFDQVSASSRGNITYASAIANLNVLDYEYHFRLVDFFLAGDIRNSLLLYKDIRDKGFDSQFFVNGLAEHIRSLMVAADPTTIPLLEVGRDVAERYKNQAARIKPSWFYRALDYCNDCDLNYRLASNKQLLVEILLIHLCQLSGNVPNDPQVATPPPSEPLKQLTPTPSSDATAETPAPSAPAAAPQQPSVTHHQPSVPTPRVAPQVSAPRKSTPTKRPSTVRISLDASASESAPESKPDPDPDPAPLQRPFTPQQLKECWHEFMHQHPDLKILINAMRTSFPERVSELEYTVKLSNQAQLQEFETHLPILMPYLRQNLGNDNLHLRLELCKPEDLPKVYTQRQFLDKVISENKIIANLLTDLDAELSR